MGKIGTADYPDVTLDSAVDYLGKAYRVLSEGIEAGGLAQALNLKPATGGYARVASALRRYGLVAGRGTLQSTDLAKQILYGFTQADKDKARAQAWLNIELIAGIYGRYKSTLPEPTGEFLALISKLTGADPQEVQTKAREIHNLYEEALKDLRSAAEPASQTPIPSSASAPNQEQFTPVSPAGVLDAKIGDVWIRIPRNKQGVETAKKVIDLLALQLGETENTTPDNTSKGE